MPGENQDRSPSIDEKLDCVVDEILERKRLGLRPSIEEFVAQRISDAHPEQPEPSMLRARQLLMGTIPIARH